MKFYMEKKDGKLIGSWLKEWMEHAKEGIYEMNVKRMYKNRTLPENNYYWGVVIGNLGKNTGLAGFLGYEADEVHEVLCEKFLTTSVSIKSDKRKKIKRTRSTTELSTIEFEEYMQNIRDWAQSYLHFTIPLPDPYYKD